MSTHNIALIFTNYGPYHLARVSSFQKKCLTLGWLAFGIELARYEEEYPWETIRKDINFDIYSVISEKAIEKTSFWQITKHLYLNLAQNRPDIIVISGYARPAMLSALFWSLWHRKPTILLSATTEYDAPRSWWKERLKSLIVRQYKAALVGGKPQKRYLVNLGMASDAIFLGYNVVGNDTFDPDKIKSLTPPLDKPYFLAINRFIPKKNLTLLISAYAAYHQIVGENAWHLVLCGDGYLRSQLEQQIKNLSLNEFIHLPGFLQQDELLPYFAHASCFVHASTHEQWGLVVNEAMAAGLPVIVSNRCGCFEDLVIEGVNGFGFDPENSQELTSLMLKIGSEEIDCEKMGQAALKHIQKFSPEYFAHGLTQAVEYALAQKK